MSIGRDDTADKTAGSMALSLKEDHRIKFGLITDFFKLVKNMPPMNEEIEMCYCTTI